ncbi:hypothetical protein M5K25_024670 [Dendrobium thyrsiflorum]|uniref:homogentisate 1,2-dioxygenase n=1 Tax=Dendrobium thyrsiflorum TaxID=117978 RepID=A0ABD0U2U2_DENTH
MSHSEDGGCVAITKTSSPEWPEDLEYMTGFGNSFSSEALAGALPEGQNNPLFCPFGLYAEQISGTAFTSPRRLNQRSWFYRIRPSVTHEPFQARKPRHDKILSEFNQDNCSFTPNQLRWRPADFPESPTDFIDGMYTMCGAGSSFLRHGFAIHMYAANKSMESCAFCNADGDFLLVPQTGRLWITTECGRLQVSPGEIIVVPQGFRFSVGLPDGPSRGYVAEVFGTHFQLPDLGPIGANGLASPRDFYVPTAWYEDEAHLGYTIVQKFGGDLFTAKQDFSPFNVVAWHGNYVPYKVSRTSDRQKTSKLDRIENLLTFFVMQQKVTIEKEDLGTFLHLRTEGDRLHTLIQESDISWSLVNDTLRGNKDKFHQPRVYTLLQNARIIQHVLRSSIIHKAGDRVNMTLLSVVTHLIMSGKPFDEAQLILDYIHSLSDIKHLQTKRKKNIALGHLVCYILEKKYNLIYHEPPTEEPIFFTNVSFRSLVHDSTVEGEDSEGEKEVPPEPAPVPNQNACQDMIQRFDTMETNFVHLASLVSSLPPRFPVGPFGSLCWALLFCLAVAFCGWLVGFPENCSGEFFCGWLVVFPNELLAFPLLCAVGSREVLMADTFLYIVADMRHLGDPSDMRQYLFELALWRDLQLYSYSYHIVIAFNRQDLSSSTFPNVNHGNSYDSDMTTYSIIGLNLSRFLHFLYFLNLEGEYDLSKFCPFNTVLFDHGDPSINTVLTAPTDKPGVALLDFVIFPSRWVAAEHTFCPPYYHRNCMSEFMGLINGRYEVNVSLPAIILIFKAKAEGFLPGGATIHACMTPHGPDNTTYEKAIERGEDAGPYKIKDALAFMFESSLLPHICTWSLESPYRDADYYQCWIGLKSHFSTENGRKPAVQFGHSSVWI